MAEPASTCRLYLTAPFEAATGERDCRLARMSQGADVACILLQPGGTALDGRSQAAAAACIETLQTRGIAVLAENDIPLAQKLGCDGVHLAGQPDPAAACGAAREQLGRDRIVGAHAGRSRHEAMLAGEAGADYVALGPATPDGGLADGTDRDLIAWWADLFEVPCVAWQVTEPEVARALAAAGADFVAIPFEALGEETGVATARLRAFADAVTAPAQTS